MSPLGINKVNALTVEEEHSIAIYQKYPFLWMFAPQEIERL